MRFGQDVLRMTWKKRFVQFSWKAHCFPVLAKIWGQFQDFENFSAQKSDLAKTCRAWPEKRVLYNFLGKRTVFLFWRNAHDLKSASCTIFMEGALFSRFRENFKPAWWFWELCRSKMRFGQNLLRMTWKAGFVQFSCKAHCFSALKKIWGQFHDFENFDLAKKCCAWPEKSVFVQFSWKVHCFPVLTRISGQGDDFENFDAKKCDLAKKCCAWPEKSVLYNFHGRRTVSRFAENFRPAWRFWELWRSKMRFGQNVLRMTWKERFGRFHKKSTVFPIWREFQASVPILRTLTL